MAERVLRVGYVLPWPGVGGGELATLRLADAVRQTGLVQPVAFCNTGQAGRAGDAGPATTDVAELFERGSIATIPYTGIEPSGRGALGFARNTWRLARQFRRARLDLVHGSDLMAAYHGASAARLAGIPFVCHIRSNFQPDGIRFYHRATIAAVKQFVFVSRAAWANFEAIHSVGVDAGGVVYDWIPESAPADAGRRARIRGELGIPDAAPLVAMIARVAPQKDFETLFDAFARIAAVRADARLLVVGEYRHPDDSREYWNRLRRRVELLRLEAQVVWAGFRSDVADVIDASDFIVLATHSEGFGLAVVEAMGHGRAVVATRVGGIPEIIEHGESGLLHRHGDADDLAACMLRLITDQEYREALATRGRERVLREFTREQAVAAIVGIYDRLLRRSAGISYPREPIAAHEP